MRSRNGRLRITWFITKCETLKPSGYVFVFKSWFILNYFYLEQQQNIEYNVICRVVCSVIQSGLLQCLNDYPVLISLLSQLRKQNRTWLAIWKFG